MVLKEFMVWGGSRDIINHFYVWAYDADSAIQIARLKDPDICVVQWTGIQRKEDITQRGVNNEY